MGSSETPPAEYFDSLDDSHVYHRPSGLVINYRRGSVVNPLSHSFRSHTFTQAYRSWRALGTDNSVYERLTSTEDDLHNFVSVQDPHGSLAPYVATVKVVVCGGCGDYANTSTRTPSFIKHYKQSPQCRVKAPKSATGVRFFVRGKKCVFALLGDPRVMQDTGLDTTIVSNLGSTSPQDESLTIQKLSYPTSVISIPDGSSNFKIHTGLNSGYSQSLGSMRNTGLDSTINSALEDGLDEVLNASSQALPTPQHSPTFHKECAETTNITSRGVVDPTLPANSSLSNFYPNFNLRRRASDSEQQSPVLPNRLSVRLSSEQPQIPQLQRPPTKRSDQARHLTSHQSTQTTQETRSTSFHPNFCDSSRKTQGQFALPHTSRLSNLTSSTETILAEYILAATEMSNRTISMFATELLDPSNPLHSDLLPTLLLHSILSRLKALAPEKSNFALIAPTTLSISDPTRCLGLFVALTSNSDKTWMVSITIKHLTSQTSVLSLKHELNWSPLSFTRLSEVLVLLTAMVQAVLVSKKDLKFDTALLSGLETLDGVFEGQPRHAEGVLMRWLAAHLDTSFA